MSKRKICVITGSRADYNHVYWLMKEIKSDHQLKLQVIATGMHLSPKFGLTYKLIEQDEIHIDEKLNILVYPNTEIGVTKSIARGIQLFADAFTRLKTEIVIIFADRFEMLAATIAAYIAKIPIAHIHGGETSQGSIDEGIRHSITKMALIHFVATEVYRKRVIQLGEHPGRVFNFGSPGLDALYQGRLLSRSQLAETLNVDLSQPTAIMTYHPVTLDRQSPLEQIKIILESIEGLDIQVIFTKSNADAHGEAINRQIEKFCLTNPKKFKLFSFLGQEKYYSSLKHCHLMIGNSSSGFVEAPTFKIPVVNIGDRQKGRMHSRNIIDADCNPSEIKRAVRLALSSAFRSRLTGLKNPHEHFKNGKASFYIKEKIKRFSLQGTQLKKEFYDVSFKI